MCWADTNWPSFARIRTCHCRSSYDPVHQRSLLPSLEKMMRRIATTIAVATVVVATGAMAGGVPALAASHGAKATTASSFYLSLGDSLAQGVQPNAQGVSVETKQGYPDQLFTALRLGNPTLKLVKLGCPGETTLTMIKGGICHNYSLGSQLKQAVAFLA